MAGAVTDLLVGPGDRVSKGQVLLVLEAMKMQHELRAPADGVVSDLAVRLNDQVMGRQVLLRVEQEEDAA